jgi:hypothetical protein
MYAGVAGQSGCVHSATLHLAALQEAFLIVGVRHNWSRRLHLHNSDVSIARGSKTSRPRNTCADRKARGMRLWGDEHVPRNLGQKIMLSGACTKGPVQESDPFWATHTTVNYTSCPSSDGRIATMTAVDTSALYLKISTSATLVCTRHKCEEK